MLGLCCCAQLCLVAASGGYSLLRCAGFSLRGLLLLWSLGSRRTGFSSCGTRASVVVARGLSSCGSWASGRRLSSCGARAQLLRGMWDLPGPGLETVSPAPAGGFSTTAPPGKPGNFQIYLTLLWIIGIMLYITPPGLVHLINWKFVPFDHNVLV